jgi:hypothetical protein
MEQTDKIYVTLAAPDFRTEAMPAVLDCLEADAVLAPTHASGDERKRVPYARATADEAAAGRFLALWRTRAPAYSGWLSTQSRVSSGLNVEFSQAPSQANQAAIFNGASRLADLIRPEFGFVHRYFRRVDSALYNRGVNLPARDMDRVGLAGIYTRTWFGPHLVNLLTKDFLMAFPFALETSWGAVRIDLSAEPWSAEYERLRDAHGEAMKRLEASGVIGVFEGAPVYWKPGPRWVSPGWAPSKRR